MIRTSRSTRRDVTELEAHASEVTILGVSRIVTKPVWEGKAFAPRLIVPVSHSCDRVVD